MQLPHLKKLVSNPGVQSDGMSHLLHVSSRSLTHCTDGIDAGDPLGQERIGSQFRQLRGPRVGGYDPLTRYPVLVDLV